MGEKTIAIKDLFSDIAKKGAQGRKVFRFIFSPDAEITKPVCPFPFARFPRSKN